MILPRALCPRHAHQAPAGKRLHYAAFTRPVECAVCGLRVEPQEAIAFEGPLPDEPLGGKVCGGLFR